MPTVATTIKHSLKVLATEIKEEKIIMHIGKEEVNPSLFAGDIKVHLEHPKMPSEINRAS